MNQLKKLNLSKNVVFFKINDSITATWNRFLPSILLLNNEALKFLLSFKNNSSKKCLPNTAAHADDLIKYNLLYLNKDTSEDRFFQSVNSTFNQINKKNTEFFQNNNHDYNQLYITNDECNLECNYCIKKYKPINTRYPAYSFNKKIEIINNVIDKYFQRKKENNIKNVNISFNGGEILLEWPIIKIIIERVMKIYRKFDIKFFINTNMTLMTEEIAKFMSKYNFQVHMSIDGYKKNHNLTRKYHNNKGSFDDVIRGLTIFRKYNKKNLIKGFQGTLEYPNKINPDEIFKMEQYGFVECRLAPNLLHSTIENAIQKAELMSSILNMNKKNKFKITENYFKNMIKLVNLENYRFYFTCVGLSCYPTIGLNLNISKMTLSILCSYVNSTAIPINEIKYDIYNIELWKVAKKFIYERISAMKNFCNECSIIGICRGSCILMGLDIENQKNEAACSYQKKIWKEFIKSMIENENLHKMD